MDPGETLRRLRVWATDAIMEDRTDSERDAAELWDALDRWLSSGGFPPDAWQAWISDTQRDFVAGRLGTAVMRCGCLATRGDAHQVGCPDVPAGSRGSR